MSQTTTPPAPVVPIRPTSGPYPAPYWPSGPACPPAPPDAFSAMARLMSCYEDVRLATEFLTKVMTDIIENNPAVTTAIVDAIQKAGSSLPTIGVTDGSNAQPGQVGEFVEFTQNFSIPVTSQVGLPVTMGVLQPGDWDCYAFAGAGVFVTNLQFVLNPQPAGFSNNMSVLIANTAGIEAVVVVAPMARANITVPTLVSFAVTTNDVGNGSAAGSGTLWFYARRAR